MQDLTINPSVVDGRRVTMNNRSPALTIPQVIAKSIDLRPGMLVRMTLQVDGSLLFERQVIQTVGDARMTNLVTDAPHVGMWKLPVREVLKPIVIHDEKKVVCNGESPAITINKHVAQAIGMTNGSLVRFTLHTDGSVRVQMMVQAHSRSGVITVPDKRNLDHYAAAGPVTIPAGRVIRKRDRVLPAYVANA